jgi:hypothetical protein
MVLALVLSSTGMLPAISRLAHDQCGEHAESVPGHSGSDKDHCADCSANCAVCICCPLRAEPAGRIGAAMPLRPDPQPLTGLMRTSRVLPGTRSEIFRPPRA